MAELMRNFMSGPAGSIVFAVMVSAIAGWVGFSLGVRQSQSDAIQAGVGRWVIDSESGRKWFEFLGAKAQKTDKSAGVQAASVLIGDN